LIGGAIGGTYGLFDGVRLTSISQMKGMLRRTQLLNHTLKSGSSVSNSFGSIAVVYSSIYLLLSQVYEHESDEKTCVTGTLTGLLYKSSSGIKSCAKGGVFGLTAAAIWTFLFKKDQRILEYV
jgi:import inner membrane translocase subunit TIM23